MCERERERETSGTRSRPVQLLQCTQGKHSSPPTTRARRAREGKLNARKAGECVCVSVRCNYIDCSEHER